MIKKLNKIFRFIFRVDEFLNEEQLFKIRGAELIVIVLFSVGLIGMWVQDIFHSDLIMRIATFFIGTSIYLVIPYVVIKKWEIRKYLLFGKKQELNTVIKSFSFKSYLVFVFYFSYFLVFPIVGIPLFFRLFNINFLLNIVQNNLLQINYFSIFLASFFWFAYHIILFNQDLSQAKEKLALFTALATTISTILSNVLLGDLKFILAYILLSYAWIRYLIECKANITSTLGHVV